MNGRKTFKKAFRKTQRASSTKSVAAATTVEFNNVDIGDWRITTDADGSLILHNVSTGNRHVFPSE